MADIGTYYIQVVPSTKGIGGQISTALNQEAGSSGEKAGGLLGNSLIKKIAAIGIGAKIGKLALDGLKATISAGSEFEQLSGGIEKIFDTMDTSRIFKDAQSAYKDLNMSANEYLATIVDVGANFASTMGDEKGYDTAKRGMQAIADYASGTGKDVNLLNQKFQMITKSTSSYQSIADQFAGLLPATSAAFLEQAQAAGFVSDKYKKLTEVPMAEYQEAVSKMLEKGTKDLGLLGNTAAESEHTFSGSMAAMKAATQNFLVALTTGENVDEAFDTMMKTVGNFLNNLGGMLGKIADNLGGLLYKGIASGIESITGIKLPSWDELKKQFVALFDDIKSVFTKITQEVIPEAWDNVKGFFTTLWDNISGIFTSITQKVIPEAWDSVKSVFTELWDNITGVFKTVTQKVLPQKWEMLKNLFKGLWDNISGTFTLITQKVIPQAWETIKSSFVTLWNQITGVFTNITQHVLAPLWMTIKMAFVNVFNAIKGVFADIVQNVLAPVWENIKQMFLDIYNKIRDIFKPIVQKITTQVSTLDEQKNPNADGSSVTSPGSSFLDIWSSGMNLMGYDNGGIFTKPSVIQVAEKGRPEFVGALDDLRYIFRSEMANAGAVGNNITVNVNGVEGQDVNALADAVMYRLENAVRRKEAAFA